MRVAIRALKLRPDGRSGRPSPHAPRSPHYRSGYALVANTVGTTAIGVAYWAVAAHLYDRQSLGRSSALVSALVLVSSIAQLNLGSTLPRFLPLAYRRAGRLILYSYGVTSAVALAAGMAFVVVMPRLNAQWQFLNGSAVLADGFVLAALIWGVFSLQDAALTGLRRAVVVPLENSAYGVLKLLLLIAVAATLPATGIFVSWVLPLVVVVPVINWFIFGRYLKDPDPLAMGARVRAGAVVRFAALDYVGALLGQLYTNLLPLLVLSTLGAAANGAFYIAWTITSGLGLVAGNFATSLLVEGAAAPERLAELTRGVLARSTLLMTLGTATLVLAAHPILTVYGARYAADASTLLALLGASVLPRSIIVLIFTLDRLERRVGRVTLSNLALTVLVLGGSWLTLAMTHLGTTGVALAWGGGNLAIALIRLPTLLGVIGRRPASARPASPARLPSVRAEPPSPSVTPRQPTWRRQPGSHRRPAAGRHRASSAPTADSAGPS
jgi:O-antigen/teichoic acid export membrane protein